jgi:putative DNA methylase
VSRRELKWRWGDIQMPKKLIEVALPLEAINREAAREKSIRHGHPSTLHLWWARRPLAACRAVLFAQLVDDPSAHPEDFPTEEAQDAERQRLFRIIEELVPWEASNDEAVLERARAEIRRSCGGNPPPVLDPFCGGGSIPLEAQRLGLEAHASDLNPVAVLITKALIEIPPRFADRPPMHPSPGKMDLDESWSGARGLADDVRYYGHWIRDEAESRIGQLYPRVALPEGGAATVIAWLWARTITCPNPACRATMPLVNSFALSRRRGREAWLQPRAEGKGVQFHIRSGAGCPTGGTVGRSGATCLVCDAPVPLPHVRAEAKAGRMGAQLLATIAEGARHRIYLPAEETQLAASMVRRPADVPETDLPVNPRAFTTPNYGINKHWQLFTNRQLTVLTTFCDLVDEARKQVLSDGADPTYADAVGAYLGLCIGRLANRCSTQCFWDAGGEGVMQVFARNALPMVWVYAEANPLSESSGNFEGQVGYLVEALARTPAGPPAEAHQHDAASSLGTRAMMVATDPPYYDNVPYADLSDFFYVWLRRCLRSTFPELFSTVLVPKADELIAEPARQGSWEAAAAFFETRLRRAFGEITAVQHPDYPFTMFYAFKQSETDEGGGRSSTGWETMLAGLIETGCAITGTWPVRTEQPGGLREVGRNALASSIVLVCRPRAETAGVTDRRGFLGALKAELPRALRDMQKGNIAPVDLAQAAIGPGMAVFSQYAKVIEPSGEAMRVRTALGIINQVLDEVLAEQEGEFDADTRWAIKWFEQCGFEAGDYGIAEVLATATNTSIRGLVAAGILEARAGNVRLLARAELPATWDPATDNRVPVWEVTQYLLKALEEGGESAAAELLRKVGGLGDVARDLAYRLYSVCERKHWAKDALAFNSLVTSWAEIAKLAARAPAAVQRTILS